MFLDRFSIPLAMVLFSAPCLFAMAIAFGGPLAILRIKLGGL